MPLFVPVQLSDRDLGQLLQVDEKMIIKENSEVALGKKKNLQITLEIVR